MSARYNEIQEKACEFIAKALGIKDPKVSWSRDGMPAWCPKTNTIFLPVIPPSLTEEKVDRYLKLLKGWVDHEAGHSRFSTHDMDLSEMTPEEHKIANILEDIRVNRKMSELYPGTEYNIRESYKLCMEDIKKVDDEVAKLKDGLGT